MKLIHVVPEVRREDAGPSYSVPRLCQSLAEEGHEVELSCLRAGEPIPGVHLDVHASWPIARRFAISTSHALALSTKAHGADIVHNHSLWSMVNVASGWVVPGKHAKLVTSPRGTLSAWALRRSRHVKLLVKPFQWRALRRADLLHATSEVEYRQIREAGLDAPVVIIPNGVDLPPLRVAKPGGTPRTLLFLSRLHPIKGIDRLLHAWRTLQDEQPEWRLVLAGPGEANHVREIHELVHRLSLKRVELPGPLYGPRKASAFASADLFVLPSHSENFGMAVAEALAHACPVVVGRGAPWQGVEREGCGWWTSNEADALGATLSAAMALSCEEMEARGRRGRAWMERDFGWTSIGRRMARAYAWLLRNGSPEPEDLRS